MRPALARRLLLMTLLLVSLTLFATTLGAMRLPLVNLLPSGDDMLRHIWLTIRLPRVLLALLVGAALALSGCVMQGLFRNPLADPGLLGISSGAALAVASWLVLPFSACLFARADDVVCSDAGRFFRRASGNSSDFYPQPGGGGFAVAPAAGGDRHQRAVRRAGRRPVLAEQ